MIRQISHFAQVVLALVALSCLPSIMVMFMGGRRDGADLAALMLLQLATIPVSFSLIVAGFASMTSKGDWRGALRTLWSALPQWLLFMFFFFNSLVVIGEIALIVASRMTATPQAWQAHIPLVCMLSSSTAFLVLYAASNSGSGSDRALAGRWP